MLQGVRAATGGAWPLTLPRNWNAQPGCNIATCLPSDDAPVRFELSMSSDRDCDIGCGYFEILDHSPDCVRMDFLNSGKGPLL